MPSVLCAILVPLSCSSCRPVSIDLPVVVFLTTKKKSRTRRASDEKKERLITWRGASESVWSFVVNVLSSLSLLSVGSSVVAVVMIECADRLVRPYNGGSESRLNAGVSLCERVCVTAAARRWERGDSGCIHERESVSRHEALGTQSRKGTHRLTKVPVLSPQEKFPRRLRYDVPSFSRGLCMSPADTRCSEYQTCKRIDNALSSFSRC